LDAFEPRLYGSSLLADDLLFVADNERLIAVHIDGAVRRWEVARPRPPPAHYRQPRCIQSNRSPLWAGEDRIVELFECEAGGCAVAHRARAGEALWRRELATPPPVSWTEATPRWDGAPTEELDAFLVSADVLAVALARTTRRATQWPDPPAPPFHAQL